MDFAPGIKNRIKSFSDWFKKWGVFILLSLCVVAMYNYFFNIVEIYISFWNSKYFPVFWDILTLIFIIIVVPVAVLTLGLPVLMGIVRATTRQISIQIPYSLYVRSRIVFVKTYMTKSDIGSISALFFYFRLNGSKLTGMHSYTLAVLIMLFLIYGLIVGATSLPLLSFEIDIQTLSRAIIALVSLVVAVGIFFVNYIDRNAHEGYSKTYLTTSVRVLLLVMGVSASLSILFLSPIAYNSDDTELLAKVGAIFLLVFFLALISFTTIIFSRPLRGGFKSLQKKAAVLDIHRRTLSSVQNNISRRFLHEYLDKPELVSTEKIDGSIAIEANSLKIDPGKHITDMNIQLLSKAIRKHEENIDKIYFSKIPGEEVEQYTEEILYVDYEDIENKSSLPKFKQDIAKAYVSRFIDSDFTIKPRDEEKSLEEYVSTLEHESKEAIKENNATKLSRLMESYRRLSEDISIKSSIYSTRNIEAEAPIGPIIDSLENIFYFISHGDVVDEFAYSSKQNLMEIVISGIHSLGRDSDLPNHNNLHSRYAIEALDRCDTYISEEPHGIVGVIAEMRNDLQAVEKQRSK